MNSPISISFIIILINFLVSYRGFKDYSFYRKYLFKVEQVLVYKEYKRIVTSAFLHSDWRHLIFNMLALYFFSGGIESYLGAGNYLLIYFVSLLGGNLLALFIHRHHDQYTSVGASGAIAGVMFAAIAIFPGMSIGFFLLPFSIPAWIYGLAYILFSIYGIKSKRDNIGHDAHLGGALTGMIIAILIFPEALVTNYVTILLLTIPALAFILIVAYKPQYLLTGIFFRNSNKLTIEDKYNIQKKIEQKQIDEILEKIHRKGISSLSAKEKAMLEQYSKVK